MSKLPISYIDILCEMDVCLKVTCSQQQNEEYKKILENKLALPDNVYFTNDNFGEKHFYVVHDKGYTESEINSIIMSTSLFKISDKLDTIKKCVSFFTVLTICSLISFIIYIIAINS